MRSFTPADIAAVCALLGVDPKQSLKIVIEPGYVTVRRKGHNGHGNVTHVETVYPVSSPR